MAVSNSRLLSWKVGWLGLVSLFFLLVPSAQAQSLAPTQLYGCWRRDAPKKIGENRIAFSDLCFRPDGTVYHASIAPEGAGDELLDWQLIIPKDYLVIDGQSCILFGSNDAALHLARCLYMGAWVRQCARMTED